MKQFNYTIKFKCASTSNNVYHHSAGFYLA